MTYPCSWQGTLLEKYLTTPLPEFPTFMRTETPDFEADTTEQNIRDAFRFSKVGGQVRCDETSINYHQNCSRKRLSCGLNWTVRTLGYLVRVSSTSRHGPVCLYGWTF